MAECGSCAAKKRALARRLCVSLRCGIDPPAARMLLARSKPRSQSRGQARCGAKLTYGQAVGGSA